MAIKKPAGGACGLRVIHLYAAKRGGEARLSGGTDVSRHAITILPGILIKCNAVCAMTVRALAQDHCRLV